MTTTSKAVREDIYTRITDGIVEQLERGVLPWSRPWNAGHTAGRITRPLRHKSAEIFRHQYFDAVDVGGVTGFVSQFWMTIKQALELGGHVKQREYGSGTFARMSITMAD